MARRQTTRSGCSGGFSYSSNVGDARAVRLTPWSEHESKHHHVDAARRVPARAGHEDAVAVQQGLHRAPARGEREDTAVPEARVDGAIGLETPYGELIEKAA